MIRGWVCGLRHDVVIVYVVSNIVMYLCLFEFRRNMGLFEDIMMCLRLFEERADSRGNADVQRSGL